MIRSRIILPCCMVLGMAACGGSATDPGMLQGTFALTSIDGRPLPVVGAQSDTVSGTLAFLGNGAVRETIASMGHVVPGQPVLGTTTIGTYTITQTTPVIVLQSSSGGGPDTATVTANTFALRVHDSYRATVQLRIYVQ